MSEQTTPLTTYDNTGYDERSQRTLRVGYLVMGLIFLGIAAIWALNASGAVGWSDSKYAFPAVLVGAGALGLVGTVAINATRRTDRPAAPASPGATYDSADDTTVDTTVLTTDEENDR